MEHYRRQIEGRLKELAGDYPVVTVTGPRQSGKTTLVRYVFPEKPYANLEEPDVRDLAKGDPRSFLEQYPGGAILDEIQRAPDLLSYIQTIVDEADREGMFILTGSHQFELHQAISQSLAGRTGLLRLLPMSLVELTDNGFDLALDEYLLKGGYPRVYLKGLEPSTAYRDYVQTYIERDLRQLVNIRDLDAFQRLIQLCAGRIGQPVNFNSLSRDAGVSVPTVKQWLSILEASFVITQLRPYHENFGKRVIKSPKIYFCDVGLAAHLLGIDTKNQLMRDPLMGSLVENLVYLELLKHRLNLGQDPRLYFFQDTQGREVDFVYQSAHQLIAIEVKASKTYNSSFLKHLRYFEKLLGDRCPLSFLIYTGDREQAIGSTHLLNYKHAASALEDPTDMS